MLSAMPTSAWFCLDVGCKQQNSLQVSEIAHKGKSRCLGLRGWANQASEATSFTNHLQGHQKVANFGESRKGRSQSCLTVQKTADLEETQRSIHLQHLGGTRPVWTGGERP